MESLCPIPRENIDELEDPLMKDIRNQPGFESLSNDEIASIHEDLKAFSALCFSAFERFKQNNS